MLAWIRRCGLALALAAGLCSPAAAEDTPAAREPEPAAQQVLLLLRTPPAHVRADGVAAGGYGDASGRAARRRIAARLARAHGLMLLDGWPMPLLGVDCYVLSVPEGRSAVEAAAELAREPTVAGAQVNQVFHAQGASAPQPDPLFAAQPAATEWRLAALHEVATGRNVRVAVIDSMVDQRHPDLAGQVTVARDFVTGRPATAEDHGTGVAGIIAAREGNGVGIAGVAPAARLMALRACWERRPGGDTVCDSFSLAEALHFAIEHEAQVINLSLSGPADPLLGRLIDVAYARGIAVVAAYDRKAAAGGFPASHRGVIAVLDESAAPAPAGVFSAPGRDIPTTAPAGRWLIVNGSSFAAAHVSGLVALVVERRPLEQKTSALVATGSPGGEVDACASLLRVAARSDLACARRGPGSPLRG